MSEVTLYKGYLVSHERGNPVRGLITHPGLDARPRLDETPQRVPATHSH